MIQLLVVLLVALTFEAIGVIFLSGGLKQIGAAQQISIGEIGRFIARGVTNRNIVLGVFFEAIFFGALLYLLARRDVSLIWPLTSLGFVITAIAAKFFLHEQVSSLRWFGVSLIVLGAGLVTWSEKLKETPPAPPSASVSTAAQAQ
jgi:drug/metabolite transporter (DMT)-like permease